ncbi:MAG: hypothetical protein ABEH65_02865 [Halobacteriales archaeon]
MSIRSSTFSARLKRLSRPAFTDLIESIWRARGYAIERDGGVYVVTDDTEKRTMWVHHTTRRPGREPTPPDRPVDLVVTNSADPPTDLPPGSPRIVTPADLEGMLFYAIDRETAAAIAGRIFGVTELAALRTSPRNAGVSRVGVVTSGIVLTLVLGMIVFTAMTVLSGGLSGGVAIETIASAAQVPTTDGQSIEEEDPRPTVATTAKADGEQVGAIRDTAHAAYFLEYGDPLTAQAVANSGIEAGFPAGLSASGIENADVIAKQHANRIDNRSYRLEIEYQEFQNRGVQTTYIERIAVESPSRYISTINQTGNRMFDPPVIADTAVFSDGETVTPRTGENYSVPTAPRTSAGYYTARIATYLRWYLSVEESSIAELDYRENHTHYIVALGADPWPGRINSSGVARIDDRGIVHYLRIKYAVPKTETTAEITIRYTAIGDTEVSPPEWYTSTSPTSG